MNLSRPVRSNVCSAQIARSESVSPTRAFGNGPSSSNLVTNAFIHDKHLKPGTGASLSHSMPVSAMASTNSLMGLGERPVSARVVKTTIKQDDGPGSGSSAASGASRASYASRASHASERHTNEVALAQSHLDHESSDSSEPHVA